jgi:ketosteroid isomerase-like protein
MRIRLIVSILLLGAIAFAADPPKPVVDVVSKFKQTEKDLDGAGRAALFADDSVFINAWDDRREGRKEVDEGWKGLFGSGTFSTQKIEEISTTYLQVAPDIWIADYVERLSGQRGPKSGREFPARIIHMTLVIRREPSDRWRIAYFRAGDVRAKGPQQQWATEPPQSKSP